MQFEGSADGGTTYQAINATPSNSTTAVTSATANGVWQANVAGFTQVRIRCSTFSSGTIVATINGSSASARTNGSGGGSGVGAGAAPIMGFYLGSSCPVADTSQCYYSPSNTQQAVDCSWTTANTTITCGSSHFTAADIGKRVFGYATCNAFSSLINTNATSLALTTSAQLTIATQAGTTATFSGAAGASFIASGNTHCLIWGNPDDAGAALMDTAAQAASFCPLMHFAAAYYMFTDPHFYTQPTACGNAGTVYQGSTGNIFYAGGYGLEGRGRGETVIYVTPGFPENSNCTHGLASTSCFVQPLEGEWRDFQISGGLNSQATNVVTSGGTTLIEFDGPGAVHNFNCLNWGAGNGTVIGWKFENWEQAVEVDNSGCGGTGVVATGPGGSGFTGFRVRVENSPIALSIIQPGTNTCYDCGFYESQFGPASTGIVQNTAGATLQLYNGSIQNPSALASAVGYLSATTGGGEFDADHTRFVGSGTGWTGISCTAGCLNILYRTIFAAGGTNNSSIVCTAACTNIINASSLAASGTGHTYSDGSASSILADMGSNTLTNGGAGNSVTGKIYGSASISFSTLATGNVSITTCGTSTAGTFSGSSLKGQFTITFAGTPGTTCTATVTFPTVFLQAPICTWYDVGGTNVVATSIVNGAVSATSTAVTISGPTFTNGNTEILQYACSNP